MRSHLVFVTQYVVLFGLEGALAYAFAHIASKLLARFKA